MINWGDTGFYYLLLKRTDLCSRSSLIAGSSTWTWVTLVLHFIRFCRKYKVFSKFLLLNHISLQRRQSLEFLLKLISSRSYSRDLTHKVWSNWSFSWMTNNSRSLFRLGWNANALRTASTPAPWAAVKKLSADRGREWGSPWDLPSLRD